MGKRNWRVEWRAHPTADGEERLGRAVQLLLEAARGASTAPASRAASPPRWTGPGAAVLGHEAQGAEGAQEASP